MRDEWGLLLMTAAIGAVACGRSGLDDVTRVSGAGGSTSAATSSTTSSVMWSATSSTSVSSTSGVTTGAGGSPSLSCKKIALAGSPIRITQPPELGQPKLLRVKKDDSKVTVVAPSTSGGVSVMNTMSLAPWGAWPPALPGTQGETVYMNGGPSFAAAMGDGDLYEILYQHVADSNDPGVGLRFSPGVSPKLFGSGPTVLVSADADRALFVSNDGAPQLLGFERRMFGGSSEIEIAHLTVVDHQPMIATIEPRSCSSTRGAADALSISTGWMLAFAGGMPSGCTSGAQPGPATTLFIMTQHGDGLWDAGAEILSDGPITDIALVPRSDGAWVVWSVDSGQGTTRTRFARVDGAGQIALAPISFAPPLYLSLPPARGFAASHFGDDLVIALDQPSSIYLEVFDESGDGKATAINTSMPVPFDASISVLASTSTDSLLVAYRTAAQASTGIGLARFDCIVH